MKKEKIGISMINMYCDMVDEKAKNIYEDARQADKKEVEKAVKELVAEKGLSNLYEKFVEYEKAITRLEAKKDGLQDQLCRELNLSCRYGSFKDKLESIAEDRIELPSTRVQNKIRDLKDKIRLAGSSDEIRDIFTNLNKHLKTP